MTTTENPEFYLAHSGYVRRLARELVFDEHLAADVEQEVWRAALEHEPRDPRAPRAWLRALVRNFAIKAWRGAGRRSAREEHVARGRAPVATPAEVLEHEEARRRVVQALLALEEPCRDVLIARFFREEEPGAIAKRLGVPVETVRTRQKRGLERLRARLRREGGGDAAWGLALVHALQLEPSGHGPWLRLVLRRLVEGGLIMETSHKAALAGAATLVLGAAYFVTRPAGELPQAPATVARPDADATLVALNAAEPNVAVPAVTASRRASKEAGQVAPQESEQPATGGALSLLVLWSDRTPATGVGVRVACLGSDELTQHPLEARTDGDGRIALTDLPPGNVAIEPDRGGYASGAVAAGAETALEVVIPRGFDVEGRVVDAEGSPVGGAEVLLWRPFRPAFALDPVARSAADGRFRVRSIDPTRSASLTARADGYAPARRHELVAAEAGTLAVELVLPGPGARLAGKVVDEQGNGIADALVLCGPEDAWAPVTERDGSTSQPAVGRLVRTDAAGRFAAAGLPRGPLEARARAAGHGGATETVDTRVESTVLLRLARDATVRGVVTGADGSPEPRVVVRAGPRFAFATVEARTAADGAYELRDVTPGELDLVADGGARGTARAERTAAPGATLTWDARLSRGLEIRGRIELSNGDVARDWVVVAEALDGRRSGFVRFATADETGRFAFQDLPDADHRLRACPPGDVLIATAALEPVRPGPADVVLRPEPAPAPGARIVGHVVGGTGRALESVLVRPHHPALVRAEPITADPATGRFELGPLVPGAWSLAIEARGYPTVEVGPRTLAGTETWDLGDVRLTSGGRIVATVRREPGVEADVRWLEVLDSGGTIVAWIEPADGRLASGPLEPGAYIVVAQAGPDVALERVPVDVRAGEDAAVELVLRRGIPVAWSYVDEEGAPPEGPVACRLLDAGGRLVTWPTPLRSPAGVRSSVGLARGTYRALATTADGARGSLELVVDGGAPGATLELVLRRP